MNNKLIHYPPKKHRYEYYIFYRKKLRKKQNWNLFDFRSDPDPLFPEADPRIRIRIKM